MAESQAKPPVPARAWKSSSMASTGFQFALALRSSRRTRFVQIKRDADANNKAAARGFARNPEDRIPISQSGETRSAAVGSLLNGMQTAIIAESGTLLSRTSTGSGGPEAIT